MKIALLVVIILLLFVDPLLSQDTTLNKFLGTYGNKIDVQEKFLIKKENNHLVLALAGQVKIDLVLVSGNIFKVMQVQPSASIEFITDSAGQVTNFLWRQPINTQWIKIQVPGADTLFKGQGLAEYAGKYKLDTYKTAEIKVANDHLTLEVTGDRRMELSVIDLKPLSKDQFTLTNEEAKQVFEFIRDKKNTIQKMKVTRSGPIGFNKESVTVIDSSFRTSFTNRVNGFNRADSLRGMLTPMRTCYDVTFYGLDVTVEPERRLIRGNVVIRFRATGSFNKIQVDLYANMKIEKILFHDKQLSYTREYNAVFVQFPGTIIKGTEEEISFVYSGFPQTPDMSNLEGGFIWAQDHNGKPWIESVCQGSGASLWWPCKDHLSDKPDSMKISITVPGGLTDISNGKLTGTTDLPGNRTRYDWYVSYPINTYNVAVNIGDYTHFSDVYTGNEDTLALNFYCLPYNIDKAKQIFSHVKPMLALYEKDFGKYPFKNDGFTLMESLYPMEHQGAVSMGPINNPINSNKFDAADLVRTAWHETAHEWWGNSITCKDNADLWIHEAFATYAEVLNYETSVSTEAALKYLKSESPVNKKPIIGVYDVNDFHLGDMYSKGARMLHTLRNTMDNDTVWFGILKSLQHDLKYQSVTTQDIIGYFSKAANKNLAPFFNQYLRHPAIPQLSLIIKKEGTSLQVQYKWDVDEAGFNMPVKVTTAKDRYEFINPTTEWQTMTIPGMRYRDFKADTDGFYITLNKQEP